MYYVCRAAEIGLKISGIFGNGSLNTEIESTKAKDGRKGAGRIYTSH